MFKIIKYFFRSWNKRKKTLDDNMDEMLFNRDAELAESWMGAREASLKNEDNESTDVLMKKQKDFEKAIAIQVCPSYCKLFYQSNFLPFPNSY